MRVESPTHPIAAHIDQCEGTLPPAPASRNALARQLQVAFAGVALLLGGCASNEKAAHEHLKDPDVGATAMDNAQPPSSMITIDPLTRSIAQAEYTLPGGGSVIVHQPFGKAVYSAVVTMNGHYPGTGLVALDVGRTEFVYCIEGSFTVTINDKPYGLEAGKNILIQDGDRYTIEGSGTCMVLVNDQPGGKTEVLPVR